jgi:hypothetical protein
MVKLQEAENQIIIDYEVYGQRPKALSASASRESAGSATARSGAPVVRVASASQNGDTAFAAGLTRGMSA